MKVIDVKDYAGEILKALPKGLLLTTKADDKVNSMVIGWGTFGINWSKPVFAVYVREGRFTREQLDKNPEFTINVPAGEYDNNIISVCGSKSGRDINKPAETGLTPAFTEEGAPYFEQARLVLVCKKLYAQDLGDEFVTEVGAVKGFYGTDDWHRMYVSEIIGVLKK
jgi:flavin reductase (DIM6/NTAB) family NADH-FMN oxidoreductase RutF